MSKCCPVETHEEMKRDEIAWRAMRLVGVQDIAADDHGPAERLELRNCSCGSTLARVLEVG